jgi:hypothetical protein
VAPPLGARIDPDPARHARYRELRERHERLYRLLVRPGA